MERGYSYDQHQGSSRNGNVVPVLFLYNGNVVPVVFFCILQLLTVIFHGSPSVIKLIRLLRSCVHMILCVYVYDIMDDTSAM